MVEPLAGRTALVTGASKNLGRAIAIGLGAAGANVAVTAQHAQAEVEATAEEIRGLGRRAIALTGDIGEPSDVEALVRGAVDELGPIDVLVSNASRRPRRDFLDITLDDWDEIMRTNLSASFFLARLVLGSMRERGFGRIILMGGPDGIRPEPYSGAAHRAHCNTAKAALIGLAKAIAVEFGVDGVTSNVVVPGIMNTTRDPVNYPHWPMPQEELDRRLAIARMGEPHEVASMCVYLASEQGSYITGQTLHVSGGYLMP